MKKNLPLLALVLLLLGDAGLKSYLPELGINDQDVSRIYLIAVALLLLIAVYFMYYFRTQDSLLWDDLIRTSGPIGKGEWVVVLCVILFGAALRFWRLDQLSGGLFLDEAYNGLDAIAIRELGARPLFLDWNSGREALVAYLDAFSTMLFGYTTFAIRAVTALAGTLTLAAFYLFLRRLFHRNFALLSLFLLAVSKYAIVFNRFGLRMNLMLLFETAAIACLAWGMTSENKRYAPFLLGGVFAGLGFHSYIPYRVFPAAFLGFLADKRIRGNLRKHAAPLAAGAVVCFLITIPLLWFFVHNPASFSNRMERTAVWSKLKEPIPFVLARSTSDTLGMFTFRSDPNPRHNVQAEPALSPFTTGFFLLGGILLLSNLRRPLGLFVLLYFVVTVLPGILGAAAPHASRNLGALPAALLLAALGIAAGVRIVEQTCLSCIRPFLAVVLGGTMLTGINDALFRLSADLDAQGPRDTALWGMDRTETDIANYVNTFGNHYPIYLTPQLYFHATIEYLTYGRSKHRLYTEETAFPKDRISMVVLQTTNRNLWWMRDDDTKKFYHWWNQYYGLETRYIRSQILKAYVSYPSMTRQSDRRVLRALREKYPSGRVLQFDQFTVFLIRP